MQSTPARRTFVFEKLLPHPSKLIKVTLPRPLGIVFEEDERRQRVVVGSFVEGGLAEQEYKVRAPWAHHKHPLAVCRLAAGLIADIGLTKLGCCSRSAPSWTAAGRKGQRCWATCCVQLHAPRSSMRLRPCLALQHPYPLFLSTPRTSKSGPRL